MIQAAVTKLDPRNPCICHQHRHHVNSPHRSTKTQVIARNPGWNFVWWSVFFFFFFPACLAPTRFLFSKKTPHWWAFGSLFPAAVTTQLKVPNMKGYDYGLLDLQALIGGGNSKIFYFLPWTLGFHDPTLTDAPSFSDGLVQLNHQLFFT